MLLCFASRRSAPGDATYAEGHSYLYCIRNLVTSAPDPDFLEPADGRAAAVEVLKRCHSPTTPEGAHKVNRESSHHDCADGHRPRAGRAAGLSFVLSLEPIKRLGNGKLRENLWLVAS